MFCEKCGKELPEGVTVCDACSVQEGNVTEPAVDPIVEDTSVVPQPASTPVEDFSNPSFEDQPKKSKKGKIIAILAAAVAILAAVALVVTLTPMKGFFIKNFGSDEAYFQYVEGDTFSDFADVGSALYGGLVSTYEPINAGSEVKLDLQLSDELMTLAQSALGGNMDLSWLQNISMITSTDIDGNKMNAAIKFLLGNATLLDLNFLLDAEENDMFFGIPNLGDKYLSLGNSLDDATAIAPSITITPEMIEALPTEDEINDLLNKYLGIIFEDFGKVSKTSKEIEVGDCEEDVTVLKYKLTAKDLIELAETILKELRTDADVKGYIKDFENFFAKEYEDLLEGSGYEKGAIYDTFKEAIDGLLDEIDAAEAPNITILTLTDYVNADHEIVGRKLDMGGMELLSYLTATEGNNFAFEASCEMAGFSITGEGEKKGDAVNAEYTLTMNETDILNVAFIDFDGTVGDIKIKPSAELLSLVLGGNTESSVASMLDPALKISLGENSVALSLLSKNDALVTLTMSATTDSGDEVKMPDENKVVDLENADDWAASLDLGKLVDALEEAGLPSELVTMLEGMDWDALMSGMGDVGYGDAFGDEYLDDEFFDDEYFDDEYFDDEYFGDDTWGDDFSEDLFEDELYF